MKKLTLCLLISSAQVYAGGIPTFDGAGNIQAVINTIENAQQVVNQYEEIRNQVDQFRKLDEQLTQQIDQFRAITGSYDIGALLNSDEYQAARRFVPAEWGETIDLIEGLYGGGGMDSLRGYVESAQSDDIRYSADELYQDTETEDALSYVKESNAAVAQVSVGKSTYARSMQRIEDMEVLTGQIDSATDLKAAIDLQNRIQAEKGILVAELIRLQSTAQINESEMRINEHNLRAADTAMARGVIPSL